ncbi:acyl-CoA dehydrogenase family protein [Brevibacillus sp. H7]|uniref:acyl-CoA dehydrogenase family protein n=1 Tax=Brevibacillus sp. H7 TaxID=3349138 RepID=UPI003814D23A
MGHWIFTEEHEMLRKTVRKFVEKEITPYVEQWEREGRVPRSVFHRMGELGFLGMSVPEEYGGSGLDMISEAVLLEEIGRCGSGGTAASIGAHIGIALPPIYHFGNDDQKRKYVPVGLSGEKIFALAITEPDAGSDVSSIRTRAEKRDDHYLLHGSKMFITNGVQADYIVVAAKTAPEKGYRGISLFLVDAKTEGVRVGKKLDKLGWRASDTAEFIFDGVKVPSTNLIGQENEGFTYIMKNFQWERIVLGLLAIVTSELALQAAMEYSKKRKQFGGPIAHFQVLRHMMVDMAVDIEKAKAIAYHAIDLYRQGMDVTTEATMAKTFATEMAARVTDKAVQIHGGSGYMMEMPVQRYWRDARLLTIGGGTTQIMNEILVKRLGIL